MNTKEKIIEILNGAESAVFWDGSDQGFIEKIANHLISNGVTLLPETGIGDMSDGYHTFNELYHHRAVLFSVICNLHPLCSWKAKKHHDGTMYDGMFIVGINTPEGQATYHYDIDPYWDMFKVPEAEFAPEWDGHTADEAIRRIALLGSDGKDSDVPAKWISVKDGLPKLIPCDAGTAYSEAVNVLTSGRKVLTAIWDGFDWICDAEFWDAEDEEITHWTPALLPLPQPPKGE